MLDTIIGRATGHLTEILAPALTAIAALGAGWKMGHDTAVKAAQAVVIDKVEGANEVEERINAATTDELEAGRKKWTR